MEITEQIGPGDGTVQGEVSRTGPDIKPDIKSDTWQPNQQDRPRGKRRTNYALAGVLLASGLSYAEVAAKTGAGNGESLRRGLARKGVTAKTVRACPIPDERVQSAAVRVSVAGAEIIREKLSGRLHDQIAHLAASPVTKLASQGQGEAATLKTMADTFKSLHGGSESTFLVFGVDQLCDRSAPEPIEVESSVQTR